MWKKIGLWAAKIGINLGEMFVPDPLEEAVTNPIQDKIDQELAKPSRRRRTRNQIIADLEAEIEHLDEDLARPMNTKERERHVKKLEAAYKKLYDFKDKTTPPESPLEGPAERPTPTTLEN